jgi:PTS system ascorbate-specific IIA component
VRRACLGLVSLNRPVEFGHHDNDPVDLVFSMGAVDHDGHVAALRELAQLLQDETALARIRLAADDRGLLAAIRSRPDRPRS